MDPIKNILGPQKCSYCKTGYLNSEGSCNKCGYDDAERQILNLERKHGY